MEYGMKRLRLPTSYEEVNFSLGIVFSTRLRRVLFI